MSYVPPTPKRAARPRKTAIMLLMICLFTASMILAAIIVMSRH